MGNVFQDALGCSWLMVDRLDVDQCFEWFVPTGAFVFEICLLLLLMLPFNGIRACGISSTLYDWHGFGRILVQLVRWCIGGIPCETWQYLNTVNNIQSQALKSHIIVPQKH